MLAVSPLALIAAGTFFSKNMLMIFCSDSSYFVGSLGVVRGVFNLD